MSFRGPRDDGTDWPSFPRQKECAGCCGASCKVAAEVKALAAQVAALQARVSGLEGTPVVDSVGESPTETVAGVLHPSYKSGF